MTRDEFKDYVATTWPNYHHSVGLMEDAEPFWIPEVRDGWQASHFAVCWVTTNTGSGNELFWEWCDINLSKSPMCFMSDNFVKMEWWGFNTEEDMMLFLLRWA